MRRTNAAGAAGWIAALAACGGCNGDPGGAPRDAAAEGTDAADAPTVAVTVADPEVAATVAAVDPHRVGEDVATLVGFGTRNSCSLQEDPARGIGAARRWLQARLAEVPGVQVGLDPFTTLVCTPGGTPEQNVVAWIPGAGDPSRVIVVGGHYDSLGDATSAARTVDGTIDAPGANDSGSQTAVILAAARAMAGHRYAATVVFAAFAVEEQGLEGSRHLAGSLASVVPGARVEAMLDCDIVGGDAGANDAAALQQFRLYAPGTPREIGGTVDEIPERQGSADDTSPSRGLQRYVGTWGGLYVPAMAMLPHLREDRPGRSSDHASFLAAGIPSVRFIEAVEDRAHQHTAEDTLANMTPAYTARVAQVVVAVAASLARAPAAPEGLAVTGAARGAVTLGWTPPAAASGVDHYVAAARPAAEITYARRVTLPAGAGSTVSARDLGVGDTDTFFVSVAAVDAAGHESPFAYPEFRCDAAGCSVQPGSLDVTAARRL